MTSDLRNLQLDHGATKLTMLAEWDSPHSLVRGALNDYVVSANWSSTGWAPISREQAACHWPPLSIRFAKAFLLGQRSVISRNSAGYLHDSEAGVREHICVIDR